MKSTGILTVLAGIVLVSTFWADQCTAQRRGFGGQRGGFGRGQQPVSEMDLLQIREVLQHLEDDFGLDQDTRKKVDEVIEELDQQISEKRQAMMQDLRELGQDERQQMMEEARRANRELNNAAFKQIKPMLDRKQLRRLGELKMQRMGNAALQDSLIQEILGFTEEQADQIAAQRNTLQEKRRKFMEDMREQMRGGDRESMRERMMEMQDEMQEMSKDAEEAIANLLSDEQKKKLESLKGKAFKFPERRRRRDSTVAQGLLALRPGVAIEQD